MDITYYSNVMFTPTLKLEIFTIFMNMEKKHFTISLPILPLSKIIFQSKVFFCVICFYYKYFQSINIYVILFEIYHLIIIYLNTIFKKHWEQYFIKSISDKFEVGTIFDPNIIKVNKIEQWTGNVTLRNIIESFKTAYYTL